VIVDFHNHYYPPAYLEAFASGGSPIRVTSDAEGNPVLHSPGDKNILVPGHRDLAFRREVLRQAGVDRQVLSFTAPGTMIETAERSAELARAVNDGLAAAANDESSPFTALATLPLNHPRAADDEARRVLEELGLAGFMPFSNVNGLGLHDETFWPLWKRASDARAVVYIHPTYPVGVDSMREYWLMPLVGFPFDTTLAAAGLIFSGVVERYPGIRWVLAHLGGTIPYLAERLDRGYEAFAECRRRISKPPSEYLRRFYYDTVNFDPGALRLALDFAGAERLLAGSDYPHQIGSLEKMLASIRALGLPPADEERILGGNAVELLGLRGGPAPGGRASRSRVAE
jgi:aminocarboxymuconate-semialdehyde decarboxylase